MLRRQQLALKKGEDGEEDHPETDTKTGKKGKGKGRGGKGKGRGKPKATPKASPKKKPGRKPKKVAQSTSQESEVEGGNPRSRKSRKVEAEAVEVPDPTTEATPKTIPEEKAPGKRKRPSMASSSKSDGTPKGNKAKVPKVVKETEKVGDEEGKSPKAKSFARRDRPSKDPSAIQKWDSIREAFNEEIREIVIGMGRSVSKIEERSRDHCF